MSRGEGGVMCAGDGYFGRGKVMAHTHFYPGLRKMGCNILSSYPPLMLGCSR